MKDSRRWTMLFLYSILQWVGGTIWIALATISDTAQVYYSSSIEIINLFSLSFLILQLPMAPLSSYFLRKSYHWTMMVSFIVSVLGVWIKVLAAHNVGLALLGQWLVGAMNSLTLAGCSTLTALWFEPHEQTIAVAIASTSNLLGAGCGLVISPYVLDITTLNLVQASYTTFGAILNVALSRNKPDNRDNQKSKFKEEVKIIFKDCYLLALIFFISSGLAIAYTVSGILYQILSPFGITETQAGWIGFSMYFGGMAGGLLTSFLVHKAKTYIGPVRIFSLLSLAGIIMWACLADYFVWNVIGSFIGGLGLFGFMPLGIQAAVDQNKNIEESIPTNLIFLAAQALSVAYTYPIIYFYGWVGISGMWLSTFLCIFSFCALILLYTPKLIEKYKQPFMKPQNNPSIIYPAEI
jgi:MFS transporter, FLVCR family, MFS-domain-containing protein 7